MSLNTKFCKLIKYITPTLVVAYLHLIVNSNVLADTIYPICKTEDKIFSSLGDGDFALIGRLEKIDSEDCHVTRSNAGDSNEYYYIRRIVATAKIAHTYVDSEMKVTGPLTMKIAFIEDVKKCDRRSKHIEMSKRFRIDANYALIVFKVNQFGYSTELRKDKFFAGVKYVFRDCEYYEVETLPDEIKEQLQKN